MPSIGTVSGDIEVRDDFSATFARARAQLNDTANKWAQAGKKMQAVGRTMSLAITAPILAIGTASFKAAASFEQGILKIENLVGVTGKVLEDLSKKALEISKVTARAPAEIVDALFFITSAGIRDVARASAALELAAKGAAIGLGSTRDVADMATSAMNAYAKTGMTASEATNTLALAVREGKLVSEDLAGVMGRLMPLASSMGIRLNDVAGVLAVFSRTGLAAAEAATSLRAFMVAILKPAKDVRDRLAAIGLSQQILAEEATKDNGIINVMRMVERAVAENGMTMAQIFPNVRALSGVMNALAQSGASVDEIMRSVGSTVDVVGEGFERVEKSMAFTWQSFRNEINLAFKDAGDAFRPFMEDLLTFTKDLITQLADLIGWFNKLPGPIKEAFAGLVLVVAAGGPLLIGLGAVVRGVQALWFVLSSNIAIKAFSLGMNGVVKAVVGVNAAIAANTTKTVLARNAMGQFTGGVTKLTGSMFGKAGLIGGALAAGYAFGTVLNKGLESMGWTFTNVLEKVGWWNNGQDEMAQATLNATNEMVRQADAARELEETIPKVFRIVDLLRRREDETTQAMIDTNAEIARQNALLDTLGLVTKEAAKVMVDDLLEAWKTGRITGAQLRDAASDLGEELLELDLLSKEHAKTLNLLSDGQLAYEKLLKNMTPLLSDVDEGLGEVEADFENMTITLKDSKQAFARQEKVMAKLIGVTAETTLEWAKMIFGIRTGNKTVDKWLRTAKSLFSSFSKLIKLLSDSNSTVNTFFSSIGNGFKRLFGGGSGGGGGVVGTAMGAAVTTLAKGGTQAGVAFINGAAVTIPGLVNTGTEAATGMLGVMKGLLGSVASWAPVVGPLLVAFGGPLLKGIKSLANKISVALFNGVSKLEKAGRLTASTFREVLGTMLSTVQQAEVQLAIADGGTRAWAETVIALRDTFMALGKTEAEALAAADRLWAAEKRGAGAVQAEIEKLQPMLNAVSAAMESTGLDMQQLRDLTITSAERLGISIAEAFEAIADGTIDTMEAATKAVEDSAADIEAVQDKLVQDYDAMYKQITKDATLSTDARSILLDNLSFQHALAMQDMEFQAAAAAKAMEDSALDSVTNITKAFDDAFDGLNYEINFEGRGGSAGSESGGAGPSRVLSGFSNFGTNTSMKLRGPEFIVPASKTGDFTAKPGQSGDSELLQEIRQLSAALRRAADVRGFRERDRSLMGT